MSTHLVYITEAQVRDVVSVPTGQDERVQEVAIAATDWVHHRLGDTQWAPVAVEHPVVLTFDPAPAGALQAARVIAARMWAMEAAPFGVLGGLGDLATRPGFTTPEAENALLGLRMGFPVA